MEIEEVINNLTIFILSMVIIFFTGAVFGSTANDRHDLKNIQKNGFIMINCTVYKIVKEN